MVVVMWDGMVMGMVMVVVIDVVMVVGWWWGIGADSRSGGRRPTHQ
jgi:hypothetical protein